MIDLDYALSNSWRRESKAHGERHWHATAATALDLANQDAAADRQVAFVFGLLHDMRRVNEGHDPAHGMRAARLARALQGVGALDLDEQQMRVLIPALVYHDAGQISDDPTTGVCWDADRLQLPRVGIVVDRTFLSTPQARRLTAERQADKRRLEAVDWTALLARAKEGVTL